MTDASCDQSVNISQLLQTEITFTYTLDLVNVTRTSFTVSILSGNLIYIFNSGQIHRKVPVTLTCCTPSNIQ